MLFVETNEIMTVPARLSSGEPFVIAPGGPRPQSLVNVIPPGHGVHVDHASGVVSSVDPRGTLTPFPAPSPEALAWVKTVTCPSRAVHQRTSALAGRSIRPGG